jgi:hypothetical protein
MVSSTGVGSVYGLEYPVAVLLRGNLLLLLFLNLVPNQDNRVTPGQQALGRLVLHHKRETTITRQTLPLHVRPQQPFCIRAEVPSLRTDEGHLQPLPRIVDLEERCA